jgi:glucose/arabinose dehydrogenase
MLCALFVLSVAVLAGNVPRAMGQDLLGDDPQYSEFNLKLRPFISQMPGGSANIISMTTRRGDSRLYVTTQEGKVHVVNQNPDGAGTPETWFDISTTGVSLSGNGGQQGLQSIAFHPEFDQPELPGYGKFYTTMLRSTSSGAGASYLGDSPLGGGVNGDGVLAEWTYDHDADTFGGFRELFRVRMPVFDHPIKQARFNPYASPGDDDYGLLYMTHGDSNQQHSPGDYPQLLGNALGKMIRVNPLASGDDPYSIPDSNPFADSEDPSVLKEIFSYGFRNPHNFSFNQDDEGNVHILVGNIGRANVEEIELTTAGANHGWPYREGTFVELQFPNSTPDAGYISGVDDLPENEAELGFTYPVAQYDHNAEVSQVSSDSAVASGFVLRNTRDPNLYNQLIFNNFPEHDDFVYHADFDEMLAAITTLDSEDPDRDEPGELSQAVLHKLRLELDHDNNPDTPPMIFDNLNALLDEPRNDARYGEGVLGEMYISTKRNGGQIFLVTNSLPFQGDYNDDGVVNAADYVVWRNSQGEAVDLGIGADGNHDGMVDQLDYDLWLANFGDSILPAASGDGGGAVASIPEPTGLLMAVMALVAAISLGGRP